MQYMIMLANGLSKSHQFPDVHGNIGNQRLGDSVHTVDPRITRASGFRFLVNRTRRGENMLTSLERMIV